MNNKNQWIRVTDEVPPNSNELDCEILLWDGISVMLGGYTDEEFYMSDYGSVTGITHWMHLPEGPKE